MRAREQVRPKPPIRLKAHQAPPLGLPALLPDRPVLPAALPGAAVEEHGHGRRVRERAGQGAPQIDVLPHDHKYRGGYGILRLTGDPLA